MLTRLVPNGRLFSNLPRVGKPIRVMVYDLHTLQNRFYLSGYDPKGYVLSGQLFALQP
jgi:hypothetical protein